MALEVVWPLNRLDSVVRSSLYFLTILDAFGLRVEFISLSAASISRSVAIVVVVEVVVLVMKKAGILVGWECKWDIE